ncbi:MAG: hexose kinase [Candidatus Bipolaricaulota bacterium]
MIVTVTLNPALDKTYWVDAPHLPLCIGEEDRIMRAHRSLTEPGGKGINVSLLLSRLGMESVAMGFLAGHTGQIILREILAEGVTANFVWIEGETRTNAAFMLPERPAPSLKVHEAGPEVPARAITTFLTKYRHAMRHAEYVVLAGRLPPGLPHDFYRQLVLIAAEHQVKAVLHTGGFPLQKAITAGPYLVKPDIREREFIGDAPVSTEEEIISEGRRALESGAEMFLVSHHITGDILVTRDGVWELDAGVNLNELRNLVGADDALVGGLLYQLKTGAHLDAALKFGMAAALASSEAEEKLVRSRQAIDAEMERILVRKRAAA